VAVDAPGTALLPVQRTGLILRASTDDQLTFESDAQGMLISGARSKFRLPSANPDEYPRVPTFQEERYHELTAGALRELLTRTEFATDTDSSRYALGGVLLELDGDRVTAVGTDGRRLAQMETRGQSVGGHQTTGSNTIVPRNAVSLILRALGSSIDEPVQVAARGNDLLVRAGRAEIFTRLVEGRYPNWQQVVPKRRGVPRINLVVGPVEVALQQAAVVTDPESRGIDFTFGDGTLVLDANTAEVGQSHVELPIDYTGDSITLTLDHRFVGDFLKVLKKERAFQFEIESSNRPALLTTDDGYAYVVMPMARDR
jgi:DNA polymerase-3 subunit beta